MFRTGVIPSHFAHYRLNNGAQIYTSVNDPLQCLQSEQFVNNTFKQFKITPSAFNVDLVLLNEGNPVKWALGWILENRNCPEYKKFLFQKLHIS